LPQSDPLPVDFSAGDIRWLIVAEWLEIAQLSQWIAYRKSPLLFGMVPSLIPYDLPITQMVANAPSGPTSRRVLANIIEHIDKTAVCCVG